MRDFITIASAFLVVVALAFYMYVSNQSNSTSLKEAKKVEEIMIKNDEDLRKEIDELKNHIHKMDSIYHNNNKLN
jgi:peptidoglycan hydrolase CwlO-like protein